MMVFKFSPDDPGNLELTYEEPRKEFVTRPGADNPEDDPAAGKKPALNALTGAGLIQKEGSPALSDFQLQMLLKMDAVPNKDGGFDLYRNEGDAAQPAITVGQDGAVSVPPQGAVDSAENIQALIDGADLYKTMHPGEAVHIGGEDPQSEQMMAYIAQKSGIEVKNAPNPPLDPKSELAQKIDAEWNKTHPNELDVTLTPVVTEPDYYTDPPLEDPQIPDRIRRFLEQDPNLLTPSQSPMLREMQTSWGAIPDESRSGLAAPASLGEGGLSGKFDGCAEGADLSGAPAPDRPALTGTTAVPGFGSRNLG